MAYDEWLETEALMFARNDNRKWSAIAFFGTILLCCNLGKAQSPLPLRSDYYQFGRDFLHCLYPQLDGKHYSMTIESGVAYDDPASRPRWFRLSVGDGPKFAVLGCCVSNSYKEIITAPQTPPPPPPGGQPFTPAPGAQRPQFKRPEEWDEEGGIHPKQYLKAGFTFDEKGRLVGFGAEGPAINDPETDNRLHDLFHGHPEIADAQVVAALKQAGMKYGPDDTQEFVKNLPLKKLEPFLGKLEFVSVSVDPLGKNREEVGTWPNWWVEVLATQKDGTKLRYSMLFDHLKGDLIGLSIVPATPYKAPETKR